MTNNQSEGEKCKHWESDPVRWCSSCGVMFRDESKAAAQPEPQQEDWKKEFKEKFENLLDKAPGAYIFIDNLLASKKTEMEKKIKSCESVIEFTSSYLSAYKKDTTQKIAEAEVRAVHDLAGILDSKISAWNGEESLQITHFMLDDAVAEYKKSQEAKK